MLTLLADQFGRPASAYADELEKSDTLYVLVGPEGGLSESECELAAQTGFNRVRLGPRVMRAETAPLAAISAIQMLWGDFR